MRCVHCRRLVWEALNRQWKAKVTKFTICADCVTLAIEKGLNHVQIITGTRTA